MTRAAFKKFYDNFFSDYNKKNYNKNTQSIPDLLKLEYGVSEAGSLLKLCLFSMIAMKEEKLVDMSKLKQLCVKCKEIIINANGLKSVEHFITLEYAFTVVELSKAINKKWVNDMVTKILDWFQKLPNERAQMDVAIFTRFIMVVVELEVIIGRNTPDFSMATKALECFQNKVLTTDEIKSDWPALLSKTLETCRLVPDHKHNGAELLQQVRDLVSEKKAYRQDIAIMITQIISSCKSFIATNASMLFLRNINVIMGICYDTIRDNTLSSKPYQHLLAYRSYCCGKREKHIALNTFETVRKIFFIAMERGIFDESLVSSCVNFIIAEANVVENLDCPKRSNLLWHVNDSISKLLKNIQKIIAVCGKERGVRTIKKFLSIQTKHKYLNYYNLTTELIKIYDDSGDLTDKINLCALRYLYSHREGEKYSMHQLHLTQNKLDSSKFEPITKILSKLDTRQYGMQLTCESLKVLFYQVQVEIEYPVLNKECRNKLIKEVMNMDIYKNNTCAYVNLIKGNVGVLQCMTDIAYYESTVTFKDFNQPFIEDIITLKYENDMIKKLQGALTSFSTFLRDKHIWTVGEEKGEYISNMEAMLQKVGQWLMVRQYKDLAINAFDVLHKVAKLSGNSFAQILAGGYLVENISLHPNRSIEEELVADLQSNIVTKIKDVDKMSQQELSNFLLAFLQLSKYTLRFKNNMEHVKKCMQAITKLLEKYDSDKQKFSAIRLKYSELMFEMIINDSSASVTPIAFVEDVFHRFKKISFSSRTDVDILPGILYDVVNALYGYAHARFEFHHAYSLIWKLFTLCVRKGYIFLLTKAMMLLVNEDFHTGSKHWVDRLSQLDVIFECKSNLENGSSAPTVTWNKEVTPYIHPSNCDCFQCSQKLIKLVKMEVAALKAAASYYVKDYDRSLQSFQKVYVHWKYTNDTPYVSMLMNYSNCLTSSSRINESKDLLSEALNSCNKSEATHYAQAQDICHRLVANTVRDELEIDVTPSYANAEEEYQAIVIARRVASVKSKKKAVPKTEPRVLRTQKTTKGSKTTAKQRLYN